MTNQKSNDKNKQNTQTHTRLDKLLLLFYVWR